MLHKKTNFTWKLKALFTSFLFLAGQSALWACSTCSSEYSQEKIDAYLAITLLLVLLPPSIAGSVIFYFYKKTKARKQLD